MLKTLAGKVALVIGGSLPHAAGVANTGLC